jgi:hypothetical protein
LIGFRSIAVTVGIAVGIAVGCGGCVSSTTTTPGSITPSSNSTDAPTTLDGITLEANLRERAEDWEHVAIITFGDSESELGIIRPDPAHEQGLSGIPTSFAVSEDGSIWILDPVKERIAHYDETGVYLGSTGDFPWESRWELADITVSGDIGHVLLQHSWTTASRIAPLRGLGSSEVTALTIDGDPASATRLVAGLPHVVVQVEGYAESATREPGTGPEGWGTVSDDGSLDISDSILLEDGTSMSVEGTRSDEMGVEFTFERDGSRTVLPIDFRLVARTGGASIPGAFVFSVVAVTDHGLVCEFAAAPSHVDEARRLGGGRWLLVVSEDGTPITWARVPRPTLADELQRRRETIAPSGGVYAMIATLDGMTIRRFG